MNRVNGFTRISFRFVSFLTVCSGCSKWVFEAKGRERRAIYVIYIYIYEVRRVKQAKIAIVSLGVSTPSEVSCSQGPDGRHATQVTRPSPYAQVPMLFHGLPCTARSRGMRVNACPICEYSRTMKRVMVRDGAGREPRLSRK